MTSPTNGVSKELYYTGTSQELNCVIEVMIEQNNPKATEEKIQKCYSQFNKK